MSKCCCCPTDTFRSCDIVFKIEHEFVLEQVLSFPHSLHAFSYFHHSWFIPFLAKQDVSDPDLPPSFQPSDDAAAVQKWLTAVNLDICAPLVENNGKQLMAKKLQHFVADNDARNLNVPKRRLMRLARFTEKTRIGRSKNVYASDSVCSGLCQQH